MELDERIPFISKLKKFSNLTQPTKDFSRCESQIVLALEWNLQCVTYIDIVEGFIAQGVVFGSDIYDSLKNDRTLTEKKLNTNQNDTQPISTLTSQTTESSETQKPIRTLQEM